MTAVDPEMVIATARSWLGTPYHNQASLRGVGCDCLGLVRGIWRDLYGPEPMAIPPYSRDWGETGSREPLAEAARTVMLERPPTELAPGALILRGGTLIGAAAVSGLPDVEDHRLIVGALRSLRG